MTDAVERFVAALDAGDAEAAVAETEPDVGLDLPGGRRLDGHDGVRAFAGQHGEGKQRLRLLGREERGDRVLVTLEMRVEGQYEIEVGGVFSLREGAIAHLAAFPSPEEAAASLPPS